MSDTSLLSSEAMGTFDEEGNYVPRTVTVDDLSENDLEAAVADTILQFEDGDVVEGTIVKIDKDEVLLDIGFKSEGVIPARELSIRNDVNPADIVSHGRARRGARPPEGGQGGAPHPVQEARPVREGLDARSSS